MSEQQRIAVVTGASGGLGVEMCKALCEQGRRVVGTYFPTDERDNALAWQDQMKAAGYEVAIYPVDVSDYDSCCSLLHQVEKDLGPVDILVNNAGITRDAVVKKMSKSKWDQVLRTNLDSVFNMTQPIFEAMCNRGWGRIVNISSLNGEKGQFGQANYSAAKAGIYGFTRAIAQEGARKGVTVNAVSPGYIDTEMVLAIAPEVLEKIISNIPVGRLGKSSEIARTVAHLTADESGFITGTNISINGGQYMS